MMDTNAVENKTGNDLIAVKHAISLVRSGAAIFEGLAMQKTATALNDYMTKLAPIVEQWTEDSKPNAEIIIFPASKALEKKED